MIKDYFVFAVNNIRHRRLRSWLTMIGIFIGIAAVVSLISLGQGMENYITDQFEQMGSNVITVMGKSGHMSGPMASAMLDNPITEDEVDTIKKVKGVDMVLPFLLKSANFEYKGETTIQYLYGAPPDEIWEMYSNMDSFQVEFGRKITSQDKYKAMIGADFYEFFEKDLGVRDKITINDQDFKIAGVLKRIGNPQDDRAIYIPLETMRDLVNEPDLVSMITLTTKGGSDPAKIAEDIEKELRRSRNEKIDEETFSVATAEQLLDTIKGILGVVSTVLIGIAAISLVVGGVGIMNTMYTSVMERTKEIGIMKALGAKNSDIRTIFLVESGALGLVGGAIGIIIGIGISKLVELYAVSQGIILLKITIDPVLIGGALAFSFIVGSASGVMPAIQASKLKPTEALRHE